MFKTQILPLNIGTTTITSPGSVISVLEAAGVERLTLGSDPWFLRAEFEREGSDLHLTGPEGQELIVRDFFDQNPPPDITTTEGVVLKGSVVTQLAGPLAPGQYAQAAPSGSTESIGRVETASGSVNATRVDGTEVTLSQGDAVFAGDVLETGVDGTIGIVFADESVFSLGEEGRMTLDELVYDPGEQSGAMNVSLLQGSFTFVSGQIAKADPNAMVIVTPTSTIGIRGTVGGGSVDSSGVTTAVLMPEASGLVGEMFIGNNNGTQTINLPGQAINIASLDAPPSPPFVMSPQQMGQTFGAALNALPNVAEVISQELVQGAEEGVEQQAAAKEAAAEADVAEAEAEAEVEAATQAETEAAAQAEAAAAEAETATAEAEAAVAEAEAAATAAAEAVAVAAAAGATEVEIAAAETATVAAEEAAAAAATAEVDAAQADATAAAEAAVAATAAADVAAAGASLAAATADVAVAEAAVISTSSSGAVAVAATAAGISVPGADIVAAAEAAVTVAEAAVTVAKSAAAVAEVAAETAAAVAEIATADADAAAAKAVPAAAAVVSGDETGPGTESETGLSSDGGTADGLETAPETGPSGELTPELPLPGTLPDTGFGPEFGFDSLGSDAPIGEGPLDLGIVSTTGDKTTDDDDVDVDVIIVAETDTTTSSTRSQAVDGEVFLRGDYIELGINAGGTFGTTGIAPTEFSNAGSKLSMRVDADTFSTGAAQITGDFFLPGTGVEGFSIGINNDAGTKSNGTSITNEITTTTTDTSSGTSLSVRTSGTVSGSFSFTQIVSLDVSATFFKTTVVVKNISGSTLTDVRYLRNMDPDQDNETNSTFKTNNDVLANPSTDTIAAVSANGPNSSQALVLMAESSLARGSAVGFSNTDVFNTSGSADFDELFTTPTDPNGSSADIGINMTFSNGSLASGESTTFEFFTTMNVSTSDNDLLVGTGSDDTSDSELSSGAGNDLLFGASGNDTLNGGDGNDTLVGGAGVDTITGGSGSDTFRYTSTGDSSTTLSDIIKDFDATDDSEDIFLDGLLLGTFSFLGSEAIGFTSTSNTEARFNDSSNLLEIDTDGNGTADMEMTLNGVALTDLDINDFTVTV